MDPGGTVRHQQQAVHENIAGIGFPDRVEQETAQHGDQSRIGVEADVAETEIVVGCGIRGAIAGTALSDCSNTEQQHAQIQHILPGIAPFDISRGKRTFIDFLQKVASPTVGGQWPAGWHKYRLPIETDACGDRSSRHSRDAPGNRLYAR